MGISIVKGLKVTGFDTEKNIEGCTLEIPKTNMAEFRVQATKY